MIRLDTSKLVCDSQEFARALEEEGIGGVYAGYPFFPTDQPWHRDAVVFGKSGLPWSALTGHPKPQNFELPNAHQATREIVRVDVHESLRDGEARDLVTAIKKLAEYFRATSRSTATVDAGQAVQI
jgi:dTDP-4-amino-4,6-dideoxygalactose transaminase